MGFARRGCRDVQKCVACGVREGRGLNGSARVALPAAALDSGPTPKRRAQRPARLGKEGARRPIDPLGDQTMATTSLANRSASVSSEPDATSDGHVGASLCWRYARISLVATPHVHPGDPALQLQRPQRGRGEPLCGQLNVGRHLKAGVTISQTPGRPCSVAVSQRCNGALRTRES